MICIVGLGNPGEKYKYNRHNVGFQFIDYLLETYNSKLVAQDRKLEFKKNKYFLSDIVELQVTSYKLQNLILVKPQTFMNRSGLAVLSCVTSYKLQVTKDLVVVHDDLDIPLGKFKIQKGTGPQLHNGIESVETYLKTKDFWRIRIGVDARTPQTWLNGETYVLNDFLPPEIHLLMKELFPKIMSRIKLPF